MNSFAFAPANTSGRGAPVVAGIRLHVTHRLLQLTATINAPRSKLLNCTPADVMVADQTALPEQLPQLSALLACDQYPQAERLLQDSIRRLSATVPPQPPLLRDWLLLALFALLQDDASSASRYLVQAEHHRDCSPGTGPGAAQLDFLLQLARCLTLTALQRPADAEDLLQASESAASTVHDPTRMWLVLQLRTAVALLRSHYRAAWGTWQAAMAIQRTRERAFKADSVPGGDWLKSMALQETAAGMN